MDIWTTTQKLDLGSCYCARIGPLSLWIKQLSDEVQLAVKRVQESSQEAKTTSFAEVAPNTSTRLDWERWIAGADCSEISLTPVMPDRPVIVRPEVPVKILHSQQALFFVSIPLWAKVAVVNPTELELCQEPTVVLSNIWFGDPMSGELCYSLKTKARRQIADAVSKPYRAICPVRIRNTTKSQLDVDRFCVHVEHLNIYKGDSRLWTNEVSINFQGEDDVSKVNYHQKPPQYEGGAQLISKAHVPWEKTLLKKSLGTFKQLTGF